jgi:hypothetical protein
MEKNLGRIFMQGILYPINMIKGRMQKPTLDAGSLGAGEGALIEISGNNVAAYKL